MTSLSESTIFFLSTFSTFSTLKKKNLPSRVVFFSKTGLSHSSSGLSRVIICDGPKTTEERVVITKLPARRQ